MSKLTLDSVDWKEFKFTDIFTKIQRGKRLTKGNQVEGNMPYISSTATNNGVDNFISNEVNVRKFDNCLTLANSGSVGSCFYQQFEFIASDHVTALQNKNFSKEVYLFLSSVIKRLEEKYSFNREINDTRISRETVILPVDSAGTPNWKFMEDYIKQERKKQVIQIRNYYEPKMLKLAGELAGLEEVEWRGFRVDEIFSSLYRGKTTPKQTSFGGSKYTYIGAKYNDNGVVDFVDSGKIYSGNAICFVMTGEGSVGKAFYKKESFVPSNNIYVGYSSRLNEYNSHFLVTVINKQSEKYNYGYIRNETRLKRELIMLPVDEDGKPHWQYMEEYVKRLELEQLENVLEYIYIYRTISFHRDLQKSNSIEWKEFWLEDVCEIQSGIRLTQSDMTEGDRPFIGATEFNNGVTAFVSNTNKSLDSNVLGVNYNGSVVKNFYHEYECVFSDDVKRLKVKDNAYQNKYVYLFLKQVILQQERKYAYGYKFNASRMKRQKIMLPVGQTGEPNYSYMIDQMKWLEFKEMYTLISAIK